MAYQGYILWTDWSCWIMGGVHWWCYC